jgi:regulator of nucleoside diphosphate kinase
MAAADFHICEALLKQATPGSPLEKLLRRKLRGISPVADSDVDPLVVTVNSRVEFQIDDEAPETRILVRNQFRNGLVGLTLPITAPRGMALLGLRAGQSVQFDEGGRSRTITVRRVAYQPQAARFGHARRQVGFHSKAEIVNLERIRERNVLAARDGCPCDRKRGT